MKLDQNDRSRMSVMSSRLYSLLRFIHSSTAGRYGTTKTTQEMRDSTTSKSVTGSQPNREAYQCLNPTLKAERPTGRSAEHCGNTESASARDFYTSFADSK